MDTEIVIRWDLSPVFNWRGVCGGVAAVLLKTLLTDTLRQTHLHPRVQDLGIEAGFGL